MTSPEKLAKARKHIARIKDCFEVARLEPIARPKALCTAGVALCDLVEWVMDMIEEDAAG